MLRRGGYLALTTALRGASKCAFAPVTRVRLADIRAWVAAHHERPDGSGYPLGISDPELVLEARILAVADAYEAMTSDRSYRDSIGHEVARAELARCAGTQFDARVVTAFIGILKRESSRADEELAASGAQR